MHRLKEKCTLSLAKHLNNDGEQKILSNALELQKYFFR